MTKAKIKDKFDEAANCVQHRLAKSWAVEHRPDFVSQWICCTLAKQQG
jgi:hypothetical protein